MRKTKILSTIVSTLMITNIIGTNVNAVISVDYSNNDLQVEECNIGDNLSVEDNNVVNTVSESNLPSVYDPREKESLTTPVKDQKSNGACWAFAGIAALENYLLLNNYGEYDLSEEHARWWATINDEGYGWVREPSKGGPTQIIPGYYLSDVGPKLETDIPYGNTTKPTNMDSAETQFDVTDIRYFGKDMNDIKEGIIKYGGVETTYCDNKTYYNNDSSAFYCNNTELTNDHSVLVVGYDDNYSKENFKSTCKPSNDGAWLIKNSWGQSSNDGGYLWISYEDATIFDVENTNINFSIVNAKKHDGKEKIYQLDDYGATTTFYITDNNVRTKEMGYMNVFDFTDDKNVLDSVTFMSENAGATYQIFYSKVVNGKPNEDYSKMIKLASGIVPYAGYITVPVENIDLPAGKGAIVVRLTNDSGVGIGCESNVKYASGEQAYIASAKKGESYFIYSGELYDLNTEFTDSPRNFTIKAITKASSSVSLSELNVNGTSCINSCSEDRYSINVPYSNKLSKLTISAKLNNKNNSIKSINGIEVDNYIGNVEVLVNNDEDMSIPIKLIAEDGTEITKYIDVKFTCDTSTAYGIEKYYEKMDKNDKQSLMLLTDCYDKLNEEEKQLVSNGLATTLEKVKEEYVNKQDYNNFSISNVPWYISLNIDYINSNDELFNKVNNIYSNANLIKLYKISYFDLLNNVEYAQENIKVHVADSEIKDINDLGIIKYNNDGSYSKIEYQKVSDGIEFYVSRAETIGFFDMSKNVDDKPTNTYDDNNLIYLLTIILALYLIKRTRNYRINDI